MFLVQIESNCTDTIDFENDEIHSPGCTTNTETDCGNNNHKENWGCYWKIVGPIGKQLELGVIFFDNGNDSMNGIVDIYDGPNQRSNNLNSIYYYDPTPLRSTGNSLYLNTWKESDTNNYDIAFRIKFEFKGKSILIC